MAGLTREKREPPPPRVLAAGEGALVSDLTIWRRAEKARASLRPETILVALLLHVVVLVLLFVDFQPAAAPEARAIEVTLRQEAPPPPPPPPEPPKPEPKPEVEKPPPPPPPPPEPPPQPAEMKPRVSGPDEKTEAKKREDKPVTELPPAAEIPQPKAEEEQPPDLPEPPAPKPTPPKVERETAAGKGEVKPLTRLLPPLQPERLAAPPMRSLTLRLPSQGGGTGERDMAGDAYLNQLLRIVESHRLYPPDEAFSGTSRPVAVFSLTMEPNGQIVGIKTVGSTGVPKLDEMARLMLSDSSPFPHLPADYPQIRTGITVFIPIYPRR